MKKKDISAIILTYNEELHIQRCLDNIFPLVKEIFIIDSYSTDHTLEIARSYPNVTILKNRWNNNYSEQFNWGLAHSCIKTKWVLRLDADEYLLPELINEIHTKLEFLNPDATGIVFKRRHYFMGKWMKKGIYPVKLLRLFQYGKGFCEQRFMDEHIELIEGHSIEFKYDFVDHNLNNLSWFCHKHVDYAVREAIDLLDIEFDLTGATKTHKDIQISSQAHAKRILKHKYAIQPLFWRSFLYFCYRYFYKGACFEGKIGFIFTFLQGWWYRTLVDANIFKIKKLCRNDPANIRKYLLEHYNIKF